VVYGVRRGLGDRRAGIGNGCVEQFRLSAQAG
jgi:hypothetical protein